MSSKDDIVAAVEGAEVLAFPVRAGQRADDPPSRGDGGGGGGGDFPPDGPSLPPPKDEDGGDGDVIDELNREYAFVLVGSRAVIIREQPSAPVEDRIRVLSLDAFKSYMQNRGSTISRREKQDDGSYEVVKSFRKHAPYWLASKRRRTFVGIEFFPDPNGASGAPGYFNLYRGFSVQPDLVTAPSERWKKYKVFRDHLLTNICVGDDAHFKWIWAWLAHLIQRPRERIGTAIVLRGLMGVGKTIVGDVVGSLIASHYFLVDDQRYVVGQFNAHMASCLLLQVDEGVWAGDKSAEGRLKGLVTAPKQMIEAKGVDPIRLNNFVRIIFTSNSDWVVPAGMDERRFAVFDVGALAKENHGYFAEMFRELDNGGREALLADLLGHDLDAPGAPNLRVIPKTEALLEQKIRSLDPIPAWWLGRLDDGSQTHRATGWRAKIPIQTVFNDFLRNADKLGVRRKAAETEFSIHLRRLVPGLKRVRSMEEVEVFGDDGRVTTVTRRVWCWEFPSLSDCRRAFEKAIGQSFPWGEPLDDGQAANEGETGE